MARVVARLFLVAVEAKTGVVLPSPNGGVDQRQSPGRRAQVSRAMRVRLTAVLAVHVKSLSYRLAGDAVQIAPVSRQNSLLREFYREICDFGLPDSIS
jgi:hypothetical protein